MKIYNYILCFFLLSGQLLAQKTFLEELRKLEHETKEVKFKNREFKVYNSKYSWIRNGAKPYKYVNNAADSLLLFFLKTEYRNHKTNTLCIETIANLKEIEDPYILTLLDRTIKNYSFNDSTQLSRNEYFHFRNKLKNEIGNELNLRMKNLYPYYSYDRPKKQFIKFISISTGNDLFMDLFVENLDRDYTGDLKFEVVTDYFNWKKNRPVKSYQSIFYGFDVYTNNIRNSSFEIDSTDRPSGSFSYFGYGRYVLGRGNSNRRYTKFKVGKIGGNIGNSFQRALHSNISFSKQSVGWDNQIANGGRLAISFEQRREWNYRKFFERFYIQPNVEGSIGNFQTKIGGGVNFSNRNFEECNHHDVIYRNSNTHQYLLEYLNFDVGGQVFYNLHNTMLTGYGLFGPREDNQRTSDIIGMNLSKDYIPFSPYKLTPNEVRKITASFRFGLSYTTDFVTIKFNTFILSPETKLDTYFFRGKHEYNIKSRWQKYGEIGMTFNLK